MHDSDRTRVLFILGSLAGGGAERMVVHLVRTLDRSAFDARIGVLWRNGPYLADVDDAHLSVPRFGHGWIPYRDRPAWWQLAPAAALVPIQQLELLWRFRPHIVVTATKAMNLAARVSLAAFGRRRTAWVAREGNNTGAMIASETGSALGAVQRAAVRRAYRSADAVVAISDGVARALASRFELDPSRIRTIWNAVDLEHVEARAREPLTLPLAGRFIVAAGRLDRQKGFDVLLRAHAAGPARRAVALVILGEGREQTALEHLSHELGLDGLVHWPGFVANPWAYFSRAAAFACPSRWEGFGNVIVEAMACATPVVATDCDFGPREIVEPGASGLLVPVDDPQALSAALNAILDDPALGARLIEGGARRARAFGVSRMTGAYASLFRELRSR